MNAELEVLARLRAERSALMRERSELLVRGSEAMREIQRLRAARKPDPAVRRPRENRRLRIPKRSLRRWKARIWSS